VVKEEYEDFIATNGHSMTNEQSENTNSLFIVRVELTEPIENTGTLWKVYRKTCNNYRSGKPVIQRMGDLRREDEPLRRGLKDQVINSLKDVTPGDISMALPHRIVTDIRKS